MDRDIEERRKTPHAETLQNTVAIAKLTEIVSSLTKDTDRLVSHVEKILPVHEMIANLKNMIINLRNLLYAVVAIAIGFGTWITIEYFELKDTVNTTIAVQKERNIDSSKERNTNKNQIQYLKGRIK